MILYLENGLTILHWDHLSCKIKPLNTPDSQQLSSTVWIYYITYIHEVKVFIFSLQFYMLDQAALLMHRNVRYVT